MWVGKSHHHTMQAQLKFLKSSVDAWGLSSVLQMLRSHNSSEWCGELVVVVRLLGTTPGLCHGKLDCLLFSVCCFHLVVPVLLSACPRPRFCLDWHALVWVCASHFLLILVCWINTLLLSLVTVLISCAFSSFYTSWLTCYTMLYDLVVHFYIAATNVCSLVLSHNIWCEREVWECCALPTPNFGVIFPL